MSLHLRLTATCASRAAPQVLTVGAYVAVVGRPLHQAVVRLRQALEPYLAAGPAAAPAPHRAPSSGEASSAEERDVGEVEKVEELEPEREREADRAARAEDERGDEYEEEEREEGLLTTGALGALRSARQWCVHRWGERREEPDVC